jgi:ferritin-like metal-binding protein YciE
MRQANKSTAEKRAARKFGEFARLIRRNLRQAHRIEERAEQAAHRCYEKAGTAMLDAKISLKMSEEGFAAWLAAFELSQDRLGQCLKLGQAADRRKAEATERVESLGRMVKESTKPNEPRNVAGL